MTEPAHPPLITAPELDQALHAPEGHRPVVLDVRYQLGRTDGPEQFRAGHVPGAAYLCLDDVLADPHVPGVTGRHPLPSRDRLQAGLRAAGVRADATVVVYDDWRSIAAARAWWLLRHAGHPAVSVLDGGWRAWQDAGLPVETGEVTPEPGDVTVGEPALTVVDAEGARRYAESATLLDARPANRFRGEDETVDPVAGHVPGALSLPALELVDEDGRFLPREELLAAFHRRDVHEGGTTAVYCGSGVQACHVALAAAAVGISDDLAVYAGSWSDYITDPSRPVATGA
ncbi:sulfurtransferase [Arsenicicoccus dermatophilus]|uniref:sulfurtransferase n=1 Tax=Arsenicicoccus dermatophilus TaxID=1076331 RepID=UPI003916DD5E